MRDPLPFNEPTPDDLEAESGSRRGVQCWSCNQEAWRRWVRTSHQLVRHLPRSADLTMTKQLYDVTPRFMAHLRRDRKVGILMYACYKAWLFVSSRFSTHFNWKKPKIDFTNLSTLFSSFLLVAWLLILLRKLKFFFRLQCSIVWLSEFTVHLFLQKLKMFYWSDNLAQII
jgi:hypothetical protein